MKKDQRAFERRIPTGNVYAALGSKYEMVGKLIDISTGGLAFEYILKGKRIEKFPQVAIFKAGGVFNLYNLPCSIAYDIPLLPMRDDIESLKQSANRRCGVQFSNLPKESNVELALFLDSHTKSHSDL